jgi:hypothetical protein
MCLTKAKKAYTNKAPLTVWKVFLNKENRLFGDCIKRHEFTIGLNTDKNEQFICDKTRMAYPAGFHTHLTKRSADDWCNPDDDEIILKVTIPPNTVITRDRRSDHICAKSIIIPPFNLSKENLDDYHKDSHQL